MHSENLVPRYFFDTYDRVMTRDEEGTELAGPDEAAQEAKKLLPLIAASAVPADGEHQAFTVMVTDEEGRSIYSAALSYVGTWLVR